jgi:hypothetical protein
LKSAATVLNVKASCFHVLPSRREEEILKEDRNHLEDGRKEKDNYWERK